MTGNTPSCDAVPLAVNDVKLLEKAKTDLAMAQSRLFSAPGDLSSDAAIAFPNGVGEAAEVGRLAQAAFRTKIEVLSDVSSVLRQAEAKLKSALQKKRQLEMECVEQRQARASAEVRAKFQAPNKTCPLTPPRP